ncbi:MAG TPA: 50S ribosomal protein L4 [Candidatus Limnocylindrales bacterium]|nr:50S ribosomal protein L4 [Candidatus Limnocylindrales bacterium]
MPKESSKLKVQSAKPKKLPVKSKTVAAKKTPVVKKEATVKAVTPVVKAKVVEKKENSLSISVYDLQGKVSGKVSLSSEIFGQPINKKLLAQAVRVYQANKRQGNASTKTRGEVDGSTRKIYRQKGTGNARHGSLRAPIFVKGGIVHGPKPRDFNLELPKKMRRKALLSALSGKFADSEIRVVSGFEKIDAKTKGFAVVLKSLTLDSKKGKLLLITPDSFESVKRASGNITGVNSTSANRLNALEVLRHKNLLIAKESIAEMEKFLLKNE